MGLPRSATAHDFWIRPEGFRLDAGDATAVRLYVGHGDDVRQVGRQPDRILRFESVSDRGVQPLRAGTSTIPAGRFAPAHPGVHVLVYQSNHAYIELPAPDFRSYLEHEGLDAIVRTRTHSGESDAPGKESYARYCKALVQVGPTPSGWNRRAGLPLEIVLVKDAPPGQGRSVRVQVVFQDGPLAGARVEVFDLDDLHASSSARTNRRGRARIRLPGDGPWAAAVTHMVRAPETVEGDWESFWATLSFGAGLEEGARRL